MKVLRQRRALVAVLSLTAASGGLFVAGTAHAQTVTIGTFSFVGETGDYISQGEAYSYSTSDGDAILLDSGPVGPTGTSVIISVDGANGDHWSLEFDAPGRQILAPGTYTDAKGYPNNGDAPGLSLSGDGRACSDAAGSFTIINAAFGPSEGGVQSFDATFEQRCEPSDSVARGEVHISSPPATGSRPPSSATGSLSFSGDTGDYISQGESHSYDTSNGDAFDVSGMADGMVLIRVTGYYGDRWDLTFKPPDGQVLAPGTYTVARVLPLTHAGPDMAIGGNGRGCNQVTGSFTVTTVAFDSGRNVQSFDATFEQHCEGGVSAARGDVHVSKQQPVDGTARGRLVLIGASVVAGGLVLVTVVLVTVGLVLANRTPRRSSTWGGSA